MKNINIGLKILLIINQNATGYIYEHGMYSNQMIYAYFIDKNLILYKNIIPKINCHLIR